MKKVVIQQICDKCGGSGINRTKINADGSTDCAYCDGTGISKRELPGDLLAEEDGWIVGDDLERLGTEEPVTVFFAAPVTPEIKRKKVHVLILTSTDKSRCKRDKGNEVKK